MTTYTQTVGASSLRTVRAQSQPAGVRQSGCLKGRDTLQAFSDQRRGCQSMHFPPRIRGWQPFAIVDLRYLDIHRSLGGPARQRKSLPVHDRHSE
jgi:hypothetical protein